MSNGHLPNQWYEGEETEMINDEKQTVLYLKRNGDGQAGIETILKRELQGKTMKQKIKYVFVAFKVNCNLI